MPQTLEAAAFLARIAEIPHGPGSDRLLTQALQPSLVDEAELRKLFATDRDNARLNDPHVGLVDVFDAPVDIRTTHARVVAGDDDLAARYILPLSEKQRRKDGEPAMVASLEEFKKNWAIFSEGSLSQLTDWSNVVVAGGSVQACLQPVPEYAKASKRAMRKYFHGSAFPTSDVDLFLYGLTPEQAEAKMQVIYEAVRDSVPWDVTCIRTKHTVSIHSQYPYRSVQIVLRLYSSPAEILAGFDVDAPCCLFDGERVWANPRAIVAMMRQCNTVDMTRRSPSYEVRLAKYAARGFEIEVPNLRRGDIDPTIFERSIVRVQGLARLLVLERLSDPDTKTRYLTERRNLRARPPTKDDWTRRSKKKAKGDLKANVDFGGLEMNDYDVQSLHIPYGPGWDARRIDKLVYQTDLGMNSPYNPKNKDRRLHRHPAFFGTMLECLEDCCECCPEPQNDEEKALQETEDESYVRGRIQFIQEDPGRQSMSGSFHPIDEGEWAEQAYMGPTEKLFNAIASGDRESVTKIIAEGNTDLDRRDHVGRTPLQVAILSKEADIACDLINAGARMTSRLVDGRTALHLAAQLDLPVVVRKLLERSAVNAEKAKEEAKAAELAKKSEAADAEEGEEDKGSEDDDKTDSSEDDDEMNSSEDDWSSEDDESRPKKGADDKKPDTTQIPEDEKDVPDVFDVNLPDWDYALTPLHYAVAFGSLASTEELCAAGADPKLVTKSDLYRAQALHPLTLTTLTRNVEVACEIAKKLFATGATSSEADDNLFTIFHKIVCSGRPALVETFLRCDPNARAVMDSPHVASYGGEEIFPVVSAIVKGHIAALAVLLAYGAKYVFTEEDFSRARELKKDGYFRADTDWHGCVSFPVETALSQLESALDLLVDIGAEYNVDVRSICRYRSNPNAHRTILDWVRSIIPELEKEADVLSTRAEEESDRPRYRQLSSQPGWQGARGAHLLQQTEEKSWLFKRNKEEYARKHDKYLEMLDYFRKAEEVLVAHQAKTAIEVFGPDTQTETSGYRGGRLLLGRRGQTVRPSVSYERMSSTYSWEEVPSHLTGLYDELFEACRVGDTKKIQELCLPKDGKGKSDSKPLQIAATFLSDKSLSPLSMALNNRQWDAARLVLAIAVAQYKPKEEKPGKFVTKNLVLDIDDSDSDSECGCGSDDTSVEFEHEELNFVDIAHRPSQVHTDAPPERLLKLADWVQSPKAEGGWAACTPLSKTILEDDFEAFVQVLDLYKRLPEPVDFSTDAVQCICMYDRPAMLDELIRRSAVGIQLPEVHDEEGRDASQTKSKGASGKVYLGLNVHGKKRKDLAEKADPNAPVATKQFEEPLLWTAARLGAVNVMQYLATDRPVSAYNYYASTNSDEKAKFLKRIRDDVRQHLGWNSNKLNESAVTAAVVGQKLQSLKELAALQGPAKTQAALTSRILYVGYNHILLAASNGAKPEVFDYLLSQGVSPTETDMRGWNIYHLLCISNDKSHLELLSHVLKKLPRDVTVRLLVQQSKDALNSPLHLAVKQRSLPAVKLLTQIEAPMYTLRDKTGSTPLHVAIKRETPEITRLVADSGPAEVLHLEDGVGNTPLEIVTQLWLRDQTELNPTFDIPRVDPLFDRLNEYEWRDKEVRKATAADVQLLKDTIERLRGAGRLRSGTKLDTALAAFVNKVEAKARVWDAEAKKKADAEAAEPDAETNPVCESTNALKTFEHVVSAVSARPARRGLVHLDDVHRSVKASIEKSVAAREEQDKKRDDGGLEAEAEEDADEKLKKRSALAHWASPSEFGLFDADTW
ncbi:ankyrin [Trametes polyzona]|nr:ankyrin [Trametes polyzona]